jgi:hypothetical protein
VVAVSGKRKSRLYTFPLGGTRAQGSAKRESRRCTIGAATTAEAAMTAGSDDRGDGDTTTTQRQRRGDDRRE